LLLRPVGPQEQPEDAARPGSGQEQ
jgi:hypothetical protein